MGVSVLLEHDVLDDKSLVKILDQLIDALVECLPG